MGFVWADAAFSLPVACYVGYNGVSLARENLRYLMGESPTAEVYQQLRDRVLEVERVLEIRRLRAHYVGQELHVATTVLVESGADATQVHDTEVTVQRALESHELVAEAYVHCDPATG
jgi:divalent metal cation (Fe/Co/Zn/Cd) transporter